MNTVETDHMDKYRMFRNYMANELGIGKSDIEAWTKEVVEREVNKILNRINMKALIEEYANQIIKNQCSGTNPWNTSALVKEVAALVVSKITLEVKK